MCIGVPMRIVQVADGMAVAERAGTRSTINVMLLDDLSPGTWVLAFQGSAVKLLSREEAEQTDAALEALTAAANGAGDVDAYFRDLAGREPELPPHLRKDPA